MDLAERFGLGSAVALILFMVANIAAFFTALITDIIAGDIIWVLLDALLAPVGVIRGWLMWFGVV